MTTVTRILVVDDHPIFREGLTRSLREHGPFDVCGEAASADEAVELDARLSPDLVLLDLSMPGGGLDALGRILDGDSTRKVIVLTASEEDEDVLAALRKGAKAYVLKGIGSHELIEIVEATVRGAHYVSPGLAARMLSDVTSPARKESETQNALDALTPREKAILRNLARGMSNKEIARELDLQEKTVKNNMTRILSKLNARSRLEAAMIVKAAGPKAI